MDDVTNVCGLIFDLDGTLYDSPALIEQQKAVAVQVLAKHLHCEIAQASQTLSKAISRLAETLGYTPTTTASVVSLGVSLDDYLDAASTGYNPAEYLYRDETLIAVFQRLKQHHLLAILSNNNKRQIQRMLEIIGVIDYFDLILSIEDTRIIKPDIRLYEICCARLGLNPSNCVAIGDRSEIDLSPARELGMRTVLVSSVKDVYSMETTLRRMEEAKDEQS